MSKFRHLFAAVMAIAMIITFVPVFTSANFGNNNDTMIVDISDEEINSLCHCGRPLDSGVDLLVVGFVGHCNTPSHSYLCGYYQIREQRWVQCSNIWCDTKIITHTRFYIMYIRH